MQTNRTEADRRDLFMTVPGGYLDRYFDALADAKDRGTLDGETYRTLALDFGIEWLE